MERILVFLLFVELEKLILVTLDFLMEMRPEKDGGVAK